MNPYEIVDKIVNSKKYNSIYLPTIERVISKYSSPYKGKELEKIVKQKLHQMWGAFDNPTKDNVHFSTDPKRTALELMRQQTSTNERLPYIEELYNKLFAEINPKSIVEFGCGLNALSYYWFPQGKKYIGFDIDARMITKVNDFYSHYNTTTAKAFQGDIIINSIPDCDCIFLFKLVPLLELQEKGFTQRLIQQYRKRTFVITFPLKSLTGRTDNRKDQYQQLIVNICTKCKRNYFTFSVPNESVFILK